MRLSGLLVSIGGLKRSQTSSSRRCKASKRTLRVESLETRVPPSAFAVLFDFETSEPTEDTLLLTNDELTTYESSDCAMTVGTVESGVETSYLSALQPTAPDVESDSFESLYDTQANDMVMQMGSDAWQPASTGDSGEMLLATSFGGPAPSPSEDPIGTDTDPILVDQPVIVYFIAERGMYDMYYLKGEVEHLQPHTLKITFGGLAEGTSLVTAEGFFDGSVKLPAGTEGHVTAQAVTPEGVYSEIAMDWIG
jgi:hypothetical protein